MKLFFTICCLFGYFGVFASEVSHDKFESDFREAYSQVLSDASGLKVISVKYNYKISGFVPFVVELNGNRDIAYYDGRYLSIGNFVATNKEDLMTMRKMAIEVAGEVTKSMGFGVDSNKYLKLIGFPSHIDGSSKNIVYVFSDPFCENCISFYKNTRDVVGAGELEIHWIAVSFRTPKSGDVGEYLSKSASDFDKWYSADHSRAGNADFFKRVLSYRSTKSESKEILARTTYFKKDLYGQGTPMMFYRSGDRMEIIMGNIPVAKLMKKFK